jgi:hypothetical protein
VDSVIGGDGTGIIEHKNAMSEDLKRAALFASNQDIIMPYDHENLPMSVDQEGETVAWIGFESPELGRQCTMIDPSQYVWGQMPGLQYLKFLHERIEAGGQHVLIVNPGTPRQMGLDSDSIVSFLKWLDENPNGLNQF